MKIVVLILFGFTAAHAEGQGIGDIFRLLPPEYVDGLSIDARNELLKNRKFYPAENIPDEDVEVYELAALDSIKNFLRIEMTYETGQAGFIVFEMRSFDKADGNKLVVLSSFSGAHDMFGQNQLQVFNYRNNQLTEATKDYLPQDLGVRDFVKSNTPDSLIVEYENNSSNCYSLGYEGENITYRFYDRNIDRFGIDSSWIIGNAIEFEWTNDQFVRKPVENKE